MNEEGLEYEYETQSGKLLGQSRDTDENDIPVCRTMYESIENDGSITYRGFQNDAAPTVVMTRKSGEIGYVHVSKDDPPVTTYSLLRG